MELSPENFDAFAKVIYDAVMSKNYSLVAALAVVAIVWAVRKFGTPKFPQLQSDRAGAALAIITASTGAIATALAAGQPFTWPLALKALSTALMAAGGWSLAKKLLFPKSIEQARSEAVQAGTVAAGAAVAPTPMDLVNK